MGTYQAVIVDGVGRRAVVHWPNSPDFAGASVINVTAGATTPTSTPPSPGREVPPEPPTRTAPDTARPPQLSGGDAGPGGAYLHGSARPRGGPHADRTSNHRRDGRLGLVAALALPVNHPMPAAADGNEAGGARPARHLTAGGTHTCGVISANVYCWGGNGSGQLGINDTIDRGDVPGGARLLPADHPARDRPHRHRPERRRRPHLRPARQRHRQVLGRQRVGPARPRQHHRPRRRDRRDGRQPPRRQPRHRRTALAVAAGANHTCALDKPPGQVLGTTGLASSASATPTHEATAPTSSATTSPPSASAPDAPPPPSPPGTTTPAHSPTTAPSGAGQQRIRASSASATPTHEATAPTSLGDNLPTVSLGTGRTATALTAGSNHTCALLDNGTVKCWGSNGSGQLGLGDTNPRGDGANELGDNLPTVSLGTGHTAPTVSGGGTHTCARLENSQVKCWGNNDSGQLGLGDTNPAATAPTSSATTPTVDLGTGRTSAAVTAGADHTPCRARRR